MLISQIQLQPRLSLLQFKCSFSTKAECEESITAVWSRSLNFPRCQVPAFSSRRGGAQGTQADPVRCLRASGPADRRYLVRQYQTATGHRFLAICLISQVRSGLSSPTLTRQLGLSCLHQKINLAMGAGSTSSKAPRSSMTLISAVSALAAGRGGSSKIGCPSSRSLYSAIRGTPISQAHPTGLIHCACHQPVGQVPSSPVSSSPAMAQVASQLWPTTLGTQPILVASCKPRELTEFTRVKPILSNVKTSLSCPLPQLPQAHRLLLSFSCIRLPVHASSASSEGMLSKVVKRMPDTHFARAISLLSIRSIAAALNALVFQATAPADSEAGNALSGAFKRNVTC